MSDLVISTIAGFVAFIVVFALTLYGLLKRQPPAEPPAAPKARNVESKTVEDTRVELTREARKELTNAPPAAPPVSNDDFDIVVRDLHERAVRNGASED